MQFFVAGNGGKESEMSTNNETIKIIANGAEGHALCPVIVGIAQPRNIKGAKRSRSTKRQAR